MAVVLAGCGADQRAEVAPAERSPVYRLTPDPLPRCDEDLSCTLVRFVVWVAPDPGWSSSEMEDATGFETTVVYAHGTLVTDHNDGPPQIRSGLASFVGSPPDGKVVDAVRASGPLREGDRIEVVYGPRSTVSFVVREQVDLGSPRADDLFAIPDGGIREVTVDPGTPSDVVVAYWLGGRYGELDVAAAVERDTPSEDLYAVFYGDGPESPDALQIASTPANGPSGRSALASLGSKKHTPVTLANGEAGRLIAISPTDGSYVLATSTTLVGFIAPSAAEAERLAEALRPVGER